MKTWKCGYCGQPQPVTHSHSHTFRVLAGDHCRHGRVALAGTSLSCANPECMKLTLKILLESHNKNSGWSVQDATWSSNVQKWELLPEASMRIWPDYIPKPLKEDYEEACRILTLSPKASAALSRRCVQGAIRDFCKINARTLNGEIELLKQAVSDHKAPPVVTLETVDGIDHVRQVGNIGAHMEQDVNLVIPVEPAEAKALIHLIEMIFEEWYVADYERKARLRKLTEVAAAKKEVRQLGASQAAMEDSSSSLIDGS